MTTAPAIRLRSEMILDLAGQKGLGRKDLAKAVGLSRPHLSQLLNHHHLPSLETADSLARVLDIKVDDLYDGRAS